MAMQPFDPYYLYQPDERSNINTLFVSGLPDDVKAREIHNLFRRRPGFDSCQLKYTGRANQVVAFATFFNHQAAMAALHALNGVKFDPQSGSVLHIELARSNSRRKRKPGGGAYVVIDKRSKGEANVQGSSSDDGESEPDELSENGSDHGDIATTQSGDAVVGSDNRVPVAREKHGKGGGDGGPCSTLFIANLGPNCTEDELKQAFSGLHVKVIPMIKRHSGLLIFCTMQLWFQVDLRPYDFYPNHVAFWSPSTKLQMICEASSRLYNMGSVQNIYLERKKEDLHGGNIDWSIAIDHEKPGLWAAVTSKGESMTPTSTIDLVRFIRNAYVHRRSNIKIKKYFGGVEPKLFTDYFERLYPGLLTRLYSLAVYFWRNEESFLCFYHDHELLELAASFHSPPGRLATKTSSVARRVRGVLRQVNKPRFVSAFCQSNCGDVSPNVLGAFCTDTGLPCDFNHSTCGGKNELCYGRGPGYPDEFESTRIIGERQFKKAMEHPNRLKERWIFDMLT